MSSAEAYEYRVVDDVGTQPSMTVNTLAEAEEMLERRLRNWPLDGPQKIQRRGYSPWEDVDRGGS